MTKDYNLLKHFTQIIVIFNILILIVKAYLKNSLVIFKNILVILKRLLELFIQT